jgi:hypothetical protein
MKYIVTDESITAVIGGKAHTLRRDHANARLVIEAIARGDNEADIEKLMDVQQAISAYLGDNVEVRDGSVHHRGEPVDEVISKRILDFMSNNLPVAPLTRFLENLYNNPSRNSRTQLYKFLEHEHLPITEDGHFLAYKSVQPDYTDHHTGKFSNTVGSVLSIQRRDVDDNPDNGCSYGFHAGSLEYATTFGGSDRKVMIVKINPADVVSVPNDCECQKLRTARYEVVAHYTGPLPKAYAETYDSVEDDIYEEDDVEASESTGDNSLVTAIREAANRLLNALPGNN